MRAWDTFVTTLEKDLGKATVDKWLRPLKVLRFDAQNLYLEAKDTFQVLWFEEHIRSRARQSMITNQSKPITIHLSTRTQRPTKEKVKKEEKPKAIYNFSSLDPTATLETFLFTEENKLAEKVVHKLFQNSNQLDTEFNPIYLHGPTGAGKSHLLMALAKHLTDLGYKAIYSQAETFTDHLVTAIRQADMSHFRQTWRSCDALLIDGIDIFSKKAATQEEFFHTFNTLHMAGKQLILSSTASPQELTHIEPRLVSRFEWGLVIPLQPVPFSLYSTLLQKKAERLNVKLPLKVAFYLIDLFRSSPKKLLQAFEALLLRLHLDRATGASLESLTPQTVKKILADLIQQEELSLLTSDKILNQVADTYGIRPEDIVGTSKQKEFLRPRQVSMYLCRQLLELPLVKIGDLFGGRDHTTVMNSLQRVETELQKPDSDLHATLTRLTKSLKF